jgi:hypothetical protein
MSAFFPTLIYHALLILYNTEVISNKNSSDIHNKNNEHFLCAHDYFLCICICYLILLKILLGGVIVNLDCELDWTRRSLED